MAFRVPTIQELSDEQRRVFDLPTAGSHLIDGPPGTGKTVLALLRAQRLINEGRRPTILLYHNALSAMVQPEAGRLDVYDRVHTYTRWVNWMWKQVTGEWRAPQVEPYVFDWEAIGRRAADIMASADRLDIKDVIVDEGQDLPASFFSLLRAVGSNITVFADENQTLTSVNSTLKEIRIALAGPAKVSVTQNYRNTKPVADLARQFYTGTTTGVPDLPDKPGGKPRIVRTDDLQGFAQAIVRVAVSPPVRQDIGVFVLRTGVRDKLAELIREELSVFAKALDGKKPPRGALGRTGVNKLRRQVYTYDRSAGGPPPLGQGGIFVICNASAKGLEFDATHIWLQGMNKVPEIPAKMQLYVLASRPRHELYLGWAGVSADRAAAKLPAWVVDVPETELERVVMKAK